MFWGIKLSQISIRIKVLNYLSVWNANMAIPPSSIWTTFLDKFPAFLRLNLTWFICTEPDPWMIERDVYLLTQWERCEDNSSRVILRSLERSLLFCFAVRIQLWHEGRQDYCSDTYGTAEWNSSAAYGHLHSELCKVNNYILSQFWELQLVRTSDLKCCIERDGDILPAEYFFWGKSNVLDSLRIYTTLIF